MGEEVGPEPEQTLWEASAVWVEGDEVSLRRKRYNLRVCMGGILESRHAKGVSNVLVDLREVVVQVEDVFPLAPTEEMDSRSASLSRRRGKRHRGAKHGTCCVF